MKNTLITAALISSLAASASFAGVAKIVKWGTSPNGSTTQYKITCTNGSTHRYWWQNGEWYGSYGSVGLSSYDLNELAAYKCA